MKPLRPSATTVTNRLVNPVLIRVLSSRVGRWLGPGLVVVRYRGRRTGRPHALVAQSHVQGERVWIVPGHPEGKTWWHNFERPAPVELRLAGRTVHGTATALTPDTEDRPVNAPVVVRVDLAPTT